MKTKTMQKKTHFEMYIMCFREVFPKHLSCRDVPKTHSKRYVFHKFYFRNFITGNLFQDIFHMFRKL